MQHPRRWLLCLMLTAAGLLAGPAARAQCLPLEQLDRGLAAGRLNADSVAALLSQGEVALERWTYYPGAAPGNEPYWTHSPVANGALTAEAPPVDAWVGLRRTNQQGYYDIVYKTTHRECITQLRAELKRRGQLKAEFINCAQCEGERLVGKEYTVTIFSQKASYAAKRTAFPYVLVIRRGAAGASGGAGTPAASSQVVGEP